MIDSQQEIATGDLPRGLLDISDAQVDPLLARILLVDDDYAIIRMMTRMLRAHGYRKPTFTTDPRDVSELCRRYEFDLILLDLSMPHMDGVQLIEQLRAEFGVDLAPVLVVTAQVDHGLRLRALGVGASDYVTKPFQFDELLARAGNLIRMHMYQHAMRVRNRSLEELVNERTEELVRSRQEIRELAAHNELVREAERARIAREIHDELGQYLTALSLDVSILEMRFCASVPALAEQVESMRRLVDRTISIVRTVASQMRPATMNLGLEAATEWLVSEFISRTGIACTLKLPAAGIQLNDERATAVFRIIQESFTNVMRHAAARHVDVSLRVEAGFLVVQVRDDGRGFEECTVSGKKSFGLMGIRERAIILGGEAQVHSVPGQGTVVEARIPCQEKGGEASRESEPDFERVAIAACERQNP
ncbi:MAG: response regulator [Methyloversatilis sp.]|uniref:ATP-binding response regulator n=1 Tax=Methyloversatilis sp. TaxID=2569862 RepID=UPI0027375627|nr:response regulator [Methyloversatilis sp.]MDP3871488.1 response regulator [Methyloversatilis sp.]